MHAQRTPPTLIVGMHRSGTSVLTELLHSIGLFIGWRLDSHQESTFHQRINRRLTSEAGGHWSRPQVVADALEQGDPDTLSEPLRPHLTGTPAIEYWGRRFREREHPASAWGWKDPRNGYLLPLWRSIYPDLRVVWIRRDPRQTAESLYRRALQTRSSIVAASDDAGVRSMLRRARATYQGHPILADAWGALTAEGSLEIALAYERVHQRLLTADALDVMVIDYQELVANPMPLLSRCADALGLDQPASGGHDFSAVLREPSLDRTTDTWKAIEHAAVDHQVELSAFGYE